MKKLTIIGGGPAALMLAAEIDMEQYEVMLCEKKKSLGRKFLVAGEGGLNLTYNDSLEALTNQYVPSEFMRPILKQFSNQDLITWLNKLEVPTFIGSSNRVFPEQGWKPIEVLNKIVDFIKTKKIIFKFNTEWTGWNKEGNLVFENGETIESDLVVFALGGASWKVTGSDGSWRKTFVEQEVQVEPFRAANSAFEVGWNKNFIHTHQGRPLKNIALSFGGLRAKGELVITKFGLEGNAIYALSQKIQDALLEKERVVVHLDLKPTMTLDQIKSKYQKSNHSKVTDILKTDLNLDRTAVGLLKHFSDKETFLNQDLLVKTIKSIPIVIESADDLDKAISTLGGIGLDEIDKNFQLKKIPKTFAIGEMLDWFAPTGGYLLQGCFSMGFSLAKFLNSTESID